MAGKERRVLASQLAKDYGVSLKDFTSEVTALLARALKDDESLSGGAGRREVCAAVSAAMITALDASTLSDEERSKLRPLVDEVLMPFWTSHCASDAEASAYIAARSAHYLSGRVSGSQVKTAVNIVASLLEALGIPPDRREELTLTLAPSFAHRMVGDIYRINDVRARLGIELSFIATLSALLQITVSCETVMRILRVS